MRARKSLAATLLTGVLLLAIAANHGAWRGYFEDDDLESLGWARVIPPMSQIREIPSIRYPPASVRPTGAFYYAALAQNAGLNYVPWVVTLQLIGLVNVTLLWFVLRRMGLDAIPSAAGCLFFVATRTLFDTWWKPMFVFDVLCTTFALASILAYAYRHWLLSFIAFWLAVRSKEIGVVVPAILFAYEMILGERNWKRPLLFMLPAIMYGGFGAWYNQHLNKDHPYKMQFDAATVWRSSSFYATKVLWIPYAGLLFILLPFVIRDRRMYFGFVAMVCGLALYLILPGRLLEAYWCLPMVGAAIMIATLTAAHPRVAAVLALAWLPWQFMQSRAQALVTLAEQGERRAIVSAGRNVPDAPVYAYTNEPSFMHSWGMEGALRASHKNVEAIHSLLSEGLPDQRMQLVNWNSQGRRFEASAFLPKDYTHLAPGTEPASWQLPKGWKHSQNGNDREMAGAAAVRLYRPGSATEFIWEACADAGTELRTFVNGLEIAAIYKFAKQECVTRSTPLKPAPAFVSTIDYLSSPPGRTVRFRDFGFK